MTVIWSRADALVPGGRQPPIPGAEIVMYDNLGHVALLGSRRVAKVVIERLSAEGEPERAPGSLGWSAASRAE